MKINVTLNDIRQGEACMTGWCPIALAISRNLPDAAIVRVYETIVGIDDREYVLPESATEFIQKFDDGEGGCEFEFEIPGLEATTPAEPKGERS